MRMVFSILLLFFSVVAQAQSHLIFFADVDSLEKAETQAKEDTSKVFIYTNLSFAYLYVNPNTSIQYATKGFELAQRLDFVKGEVLPQVFLGEAIAFQGNLAEGLKLKLEALQKAEAVADSALLILCYNFIGANYVYSNDYETALLYYNKVKANSNLTLVQSKYLFGQIGTCFLQLNKLDSAYYYTKRAYDLDIKDANHWGNLYMNMGEIEAKRGNYDKALQFFRMESALIKAPSVGLASTFQKMGQQDSALFYAKRMLAFKDLNFMYKLAASNLLASLYKSSGQLDSAFKYQEMMLAVKDSIYSQEKVKQLKNLQSNEQLRQFQIQQQQRDVQQQYKARIRTYSLLAGLVVLTSIAILLYHNNRQRKKAYSLLQKQKQEIDKQKHEAEIEVALERVRARAMAMQSSSELSELVALLFDELTKLELILARCIIWIFDPETLAARVWMANSEDKKSAQSYFIKPLDHPYYQAIIKGWQEKTPKWVYDLQGNEKQSIDHILLTETELSLLPQAVKSGIALSEHTVVSGSFNNFGFIEASGPVAHSDEQLEILYRFGKVFDLSYTRFNDLKQAEAQAKEAVRQAALDRVRAEIASMRTTADLERITPLIWKELTILHVPFIRCGVFIMHEVEAQTHVYLSTPDGKAIAAFHLPYSNRGFIEGVVSHWRDQQVYTDHWDAAAFSAWTKSLVAQGVIKSDAKYSTELPPENLYLHFLPFMQGMLYVGSTTSLKEDELTLLQALAEAFSTAYARYEDFSKLNAAKQQVEATLMELRSTQMQLIQKEKMASLGELTAGIAHEIQNPLNFVNNFSETNVELIEEAETEFKTGNPEEGYSILNDLKDNEQKIRQHGKRADAIIKSMLEHSRTSKGEKQLTDVNTLADEYLRLAYHGFRAKDKSFNATIETNFDATIGNINIVPQDIGRILLNLFNNAFYAVHEQKKKLGDDYDPTVSIRTNQLDNKIEITVKDNGMGISKSLQDKIFQPFFTTKPTGQGTGLGLSLSYDIIKVHGGELRVESKEGEGAQFIIILPAT